MIQRPPEIDKKKVGFFRFKKNKKGYLITNDLGRFLQLNSNEFNKYIRGSLDQKSVLYRELAERDFIKDASQLKAAAHKYRERNFYLFDGPKLHIVVVTLRCNYQCVYCQANRRDAGSTGYDMNKVTAKNVVDRIFESPARTLTIEFQGGEPLLNWPALKFIIEYAEKKNAKEKKDLRMALVTNLSLMTDELHDFLIAHNVNICTSLDGPHDLHNQNRPCRFLDSYQATAAWIRTIRKKEKARLTAGNREYIHKIAALVTITRQSLKKIRTIIDEYRRFGFKQIHVRRLSFLGLSGGAVKDVIGYTAEEFIECWKDAMEYIIRLNVNGTAFVERGALIMLNKILTPVDPGYLDLRSPCGAGVGQLAYNYNGKVYTCDEARTLEDETFLLGDVNKEDYKHISACPKIKTMLLSSALENFSCDECVYKTYCGICPVTNYVLHGSIFPHIRQTDNCKINAAMLDYLFEKIENKKIAEIFTRWVSPPKKLRS